MSVLANEYFRVREQPAVQSAFTSSPWLILDDIHGSGILVNEIRSLLIE